jgi:hypothetical protein
MKQRPPHLALFAAAFSLCACASIPAPQNPLGVDRIVVTFSPSGRMEAPDVQTFEVVDAATVDAWVTALEDVPELPARGVRYIKFAAPISQHRVELRAGDVVVRVARMRSGHLDVAAHEGWAFYSGEDREFTALVRSAVPGS